MTQKSLFGGDIFPRSSVTTKLPTYHEPAGAPMTEQEQQAYRTLAVAVVSITWHLLKRAVSLQEIYDGILIMKNGVEQRRINGIRQRVQDMLDAGDWAFAKFPRSKRTVDRRVNEAAAADFYPDHIARIVLVEPGIYQPNPQFLG